LKNCYKFERRISEITIYGWTSTHLCLTQASSQDNHTILHMPVTSLVAEVSAHTNRSCYSI